MVYAEEWATANRLHYASNPKWPRRVHSRPFSDDDEVITDNSSVTNSTTTITNNYNIDIEKNLDIEKNATDATDVKDATATLNKEKDVLVPGNLHNKKPEKKSPVSFKGLNVDFSDLFQNKAKAVAVEPVTEDKEEDSGDTAVEEEDEAVQTSAVLSGIAAGIASDAITSIGEELLESLTIEELPRHDADFAHAWFNAINPAESDARLKEFQAYLTVLQELSSGDLEIPEVDGKALALEIKKFILSDFRNRGVIIDVHGDKVHRAFFAHCAKRVLDSLEDGIFSGADGFVGKKPEISAVIKNRIDEIFVELVLGV